MKELWFILSDITKKIAEIFQISLIENEQIQIMMRATENPEAYNLYLQGRFFWKKRTEEAFKMGIEYFKKAINKDPNYALAYAGIADSYTLLSIHGFSLPREAMKDAEKAALKAVALSETLAESHTSLGAVRSSYDWDWTAAEKEFKRALSLNTKYTTAHQWYAGQLLVLGRFNESVIEYKKALKLDPNSPMINTDVGRPYYFSENYDEAIKQFQKALKLDPDFYLAHFWLGLTYIEKFKYQKAVEELQKAWELSEGSGAMLAALGYVYAVASNKDKAYHVINELRALSERKYVDPIYSAWIYHGLGKANETFKWFEDAYEKRSWWLTYLYVWPFSNILREDPRFANLLKKIGFEKSLYKSNVSP